MHPAEVNTKHRRWFLVACRGSRRTRSRQHSCKIDGAATVANVGWRYSHAGKSDAVKLMSDHSPTCASSCKSSSNCRCSLPCPTSGSSTMPCRTRGTTCPGGAGACSTCTTLPCAPGTSNQQNAAPHIGHRPARRSESTAPAHHTRGTHPPGVWRLETTTVSWTCRTHTPTHRARPHPLLHRLCKVQLQQRPP